METVAERTNRGSKARFLGIPNTTGLASIHMIFTGIAQGFMHGNGDRVASLTDVARYIVEKLGGSVLQIKLHKLLYYCQANSLRSYGRVLFQSDIEAWANGPVIPELWNDNRYRAVIDVSSLAAGDVNRLTPTERACIDSVLVAYGSMSGSELSAMTHDEEPWKDARVNLSPGDYSRNVIDVDKMRSFYTRKWAN